MEWGKETRFHLQSVGFSTLDSIPKPLIFKGLQGSHSGGYPEFQHRLDPYLAREMTYPSDALNAFAGISNILSKELSTKMLSGLPVAFFDMALLWRPRRPTILRNDGFPSWSWAGWRGSVSAPGPGPSHTVSSFLVRHTVTTPFLCYSSFILLLGLP